VAAGVLAGWIASGQRQTWWPAESWEWIPWLGLAAAILSGVALAEGVQPIERWAVHALLALLTACFVVPTWPELDPPRTTLIVALAAGLFVAIRLFEPLAVAPGGGSLVGALLMTAAACGFLVASEVSASLGLQAILPATAGAGAAVVAARYRSDNAPSWPVTLLVLTLSYAFIGYLYPDPPLIPLLLIPLSPAALWLGRITPLARLSGWKRLLADWTCVAVPIVVIVAYQVTQGSSW
jgi:hypothetical protein